MKAMWADALALGWWSLVLFVLLCWCLGAYRRFKRLRAQVRTAFAPVDEQLQNAVRWLQGLPAQAQVPTAAQAAFQALQPTADLLVVALAQARTNPLNAAALAQLDGIWQSLQAAWQAYAHTASSAVEQPVAAPSAQEASLPAGAMSWMAQTSAAWSEQHAVLLHRMQQFNHAVQAYNDALVLPPGSAWAKLQGLQPARSFALPNAAQ